MLDNVLKLKSLGIDFIIKDEVSLMLLLRTYSKLFLNGKQPNSCNSCIRKYYNKIILKGEEMAKKKIEQTFVMNFEGIKYVPAVRKNGKLIMLHKHIDPKFVTDKEALEMLEIGALSGKDFKVLPDGYKGNEKPKSKTIPIDKLEEVLEKAEFNEMRSIAKDLNLNTGKNPDAEKLKEAIEAVLIKMIEEEDAE